MKQMRYGILLLAAVSCGGKNRVQHHNSECFSNDECDGACFLGSCVAPGEGLGEVDIDVQPTDVSGSLRQRLARAFDAASGPQDLQLAPTLAIGGHVFHVGDPLNGTVRAYTVTDAKCVPTAADDVLTYDGTVVADEMLLQLVPGRYRIVFTPTPTASPFPPVVLPNDGSCGITIADESRRDIIYPNTADLTTIRGRLRYSVNDTTGAAGAQIVARSTQGAAAYISAAVETASDGTFAILMPPGGTGYSFDVKAGSNVNVPTKTFDNITPSASGEVGDLVLGVSAIVSVPLTVTDGLGGPVTDATVTIQGELGGGTITLSAATNMAGAATLSLRAGTYNILVLPKRTATVGLVRTGLTITDGGALPVLTLVAPPKSLVTGVVMKSDGSPLANARVTYRLRFIKTERDVTATTSSDGSYAVSVDSQSPTVAEANPEFEVTVEPPMDSRAPRHRELVRLEVAEMMHDITLFDANFIFGTVYNSDGVPLPQAALLFYSRLGGMEQVLVGVTQSGTTGEYTVPLPRPQ